VVFSDAGFGLAFVFSRRTPTARPCTAASDKAKSYSDKKGFTFGNVLHFTLLKQAKLLGLVRCRLFLLVKNQDVTKLSSNYWY